MSTELAVVRNEPSSDLSITNDQTFWTPKQRAALQQLGMGNAADADLAVFFHHCTRTGLDPFARQIYMIERWTKNGPRQTIQTGIDGFRLIARRATDARRGTFGYEPTEWCGYDGQWRDVWLSTEPPAAARVTVIRDGARFPAVALFGEYVQTDKQGNPTPMWRTKGALMLAKCAEALALRKAFPQDLSGLYTGDEMAAADNPQPQYVEPAPLPQTPADVAPNVVEAEVVEERITPKQLVALNAAVSDLGLDRAAKLAGIAAIVGHPVESSKDLTKAEATGVIDSLKRALADRNEQDSMGAEALRAEDEAGELNFDDGARA